MIFQIQENLNVIQLNIDKFIKKTKKSCIYNFSLCSVNKEHFLPKLKKNAIFPIDFQLQTTKCIFPQKNNYA